MHKLICPVCSKELTRTNKLKSYSCESEHLFDIARQGYINLLLSHQKKSRQPGDDAEMVKARSNFLNIGHYRKIIDAISSVISPFMPNTLARANYHYCDIACGEGYYTDLIHKEVINNFGTGVSTGVDISSPAIKFASKRSKNIRWLIASANQLPVSSASQDLITCLFYRANEKEVVRSLKAGALFVSVSTGPNHLIELRKLLYDKLNNEKESMNKAIEPKLNHLKSNLLQYSFTLKSTDEITQLLTMTPHYWRAKPEKKRALSSIESLELSLDLNINLFQKTVE